MKRTPAPTVGDLIERLKKYDVTQPVAATWEGVIRTIDVYASADGVVIIDADDSLYRKEFEARTNVRDTLDRVVREEADDEEFR